MELLLFKIICIILLIRLLVLQIVHYFVVFYNDATDYVVKYILKNPSKYVKNEHMYKLMTNCIWIIILITLLIAAFSGNMGIELNG